MSALPSSTRRAARLVFVCVPVLAGLAGVGSRADAAEGFLVRYNVAGSLGGEMFAPPDQTGPVAVVAYTHIDIRKTSGGDGHDLQAALPGGSVPLAAGGTPADPRYAASVATAHATGTFDIANLAVGRMTSDTYGGGRLVFGLNLPIGYKVQNVHWSAATPTLTWPVNGVPSDAQRAGIAAQFDAGYQAQLAASGQSQSGTVEGLGDLELAGGWSYNTPRTRLLAGASVVLPTGEYGSGPAPDIGAGKFVTLRPAVQFAWLPASTFALAGKVTLGLNSRNTASHIRNGSWLGFEAATGVLTRAGVFGLHAIHIQQVQDDSDNPVGHSRYRETNGGAFWTAKLPWRKTAVTLQCVTSLQSRYALHGTYSQVRFVTAF